MLRPRCHPSRAAPDLPAVPRVTPKAEVAGGAEDSPQPAVNSDSVTDPRGKCFSGMGSVPLARWAR